jgi:Circularly permuted ATP-grasp type 2
MFAAQLARVWFEACNELRLVTTLPNSSMRCSCPTAVPALARACLKNELNLCQTASSCCARRPQSVYCCRAASRSTFMATTRPLKIFPFDVIPRIVEASEWDWIEKGLKQRVYALNLFIDDIYHQQKIVRDKVVPEYLIRSARSFREACVGLNPPQGIWCHITGTDLVRDRDGQIYVLEDNLRCPSGVSYVLENRRVMKRTFPQVFEASRVRPVDEYPSRLLSMLQSLFPTAAESPKVAVLTPGIYNSAYFEHAFLGAADGRGTGGRARLGGR